MLEEVTVGSQQIPGLSIASPQFSSVGSMKAADGGDFLLASGPAVRPGGTLNVTITGLPVHSSTPRNIALLREEGRLVQIAFLRGSKAELDLNAVMRKRILVTGSTLRPRPVAAKGLIADSLRRTVLPWLEDGSVWPVIHETFPLARAAEAHAALEADRHVGKIVLEISPLTR